MAATRAVSWSVIVARLRHDLADAKGRRWKASYLRDRALDFVEWALERRPELFEATRIVDVAWPLSLPDCCARVTQIFAEVDAQGRPIESVNFSSRRQVAYTRRMCSATDEAPVRFAIDQTSRGGIVASRPFTGNKRLMVRCVARPTVTRSAIDLPAAALPLLYDWVVAKVMGVDHDSATTANVARLKEQSTDAAVAQARKTVVDEVRLAKSGTP